MSVLIIADPASGALAEATGRVVSAAAALGGEAHVLVAGWNCAGAAEAAANLNGVSKVLLCDDPALAHSPPETLAPLIAACGKSYRRLVVDSGAFGKNLMPRVAAILDAPQASDVTRILDHETFQRPVYSGAILETVRIVDPLACLTLRANLFDPPGAAAFPALIEALSLPPDLHDLSQWLEDIVVETGRPDLGSAKVVVSGGRGLANTGGVKLLEDFAAALGAAVGATRVAVDEGLLPNEAQVGQTGRAVAPDLYVAVGISGAVQHLAGMKDAKVIVAINKDEEAPIFRIADYALVADLFDALPKLTAALRNR